MSISDSASLHFEAKTGGSSYMSKAQARQLERIRKDEKIEAQGQLVKNDLKATLRASWNESLEEASERRSLKHKTEDIKQELRLANKALIEVRKAQLMKLLQEEQRQHEAELHSMGLAFHRDRI